MNLKFIIKVNVIFTSLIYITCINGKPFPTPKPEAIIRCTGYSNETLCGKNGKCEETVVKNTVNSKNKDLTKEKVCVCDDNYGTLSFDKNPCLRKRTSKSLALFMQIFFGWIQVGAFILNWLMYGLSVFIIYITLCCCTCALMFRNQNDDDDDDNNNDKNNLIGLCLKCSSACSVLGIWLATLIYIITDCYSVIEIKNGDNMGAHSLKCWDNI